MVECLDIQFPCRKLSDENRCRLDEYKVKLTEKKHILFMDVSSAEAMNSSWVFEIGKE